MIRHKRPRWLIVVPEIPRPDQAGGDRRLFELLTMLSAQCEISLLTMYMWRPDDDRYLEALKKLNVRVIGTIQEHGIPTLIRHTFEAIFFEFYYATGMKLAEMARILQPNTLLIVDSVDLHFLRQREAVRLGLLAPEIANTTELDELAAYRSVDITVVVTDGEKQCLHQCGLSNVVVIPIIVPATPRKAHVRNAELLFVGGFNHLPNGSAVEWFAGSIWPLVRQQVPHAQWTIAGSNTPASVKELDGKDGITVLGYVKSTAPLLDKAQVSIAPLTYGGGMKVKVCEALAGGLPLVTTKWGAQGLERGSGIAFLQADDPENFSNAIVRLLNDEELRDRISQQAHLLAEKSCSTAVAAPVLDALIVESRKKRGKVWPRGRVRKYLALVLAWPKTNTDASRRIGVG